jgi:hypothetical protein
MFIYKQGYLFSYIFLPRAKFLYRVPFLAQIRARRGFARGTKLVQKTGRRVLQNPVPFFHENFTIFLEEQKTIIYLQL